MIKNLKRNWQKLHQLLTGTPEEQKEAAQGLAEQAIRDAGPQTPTPGNPGLEHPQEHFQQTKARGSHGD